jgi:hypothetical protein
MEGTVMTTRIDVDKIVVDDDGRIYPEAAAALIDEVQEYRRLLDQGREIVWASEHDHADGARLRMYGTKHVWLARVSSALGESPPQYVDRLYMPEESE